MRRKETVLHRGSSCKKIPLVTLCLLLLSMISRNSDIFLTTTMAWTMHRSFRQLASRLHSPTLPSLFLLTEPTRVTRIAFGSDSFRGTNRRIGNHQYASSNRAASSDSSTRLYSYQDFLTQEKHSTILVSYFTDIEGDKFYLDRYVDNSKILKWIANNKRTDPGETPSQAFSMYSYPECPPTSFPYDRRIDFCNSNSILVFGGDLWDKGGFDLYVTRQLLDLKRRYPDRVVWVLGNRDINKLRMTQELGLPAKSTPSSKVSVPYHPGLTWFRGSGRVGDPEGPLPSMDPGNRLKWILGNTMGSPDAMEHRRQELLWERRGCHEDSSKSINGNEAKNSISDMDVVRSYQESCHPFGEMGQFLSEGLLAARVGPILLVHGSLPLTKDTMAEAKENQSKTSIWDDLTFCMPWMNQTHHDYGKHHQFSTASDFGVKTIEDWLEVVNEFCVTNVQAWKNHIVEIEQNFEHNGQSEEIFDDRHEEESKDAIWAYRGGYGNGPSYSGTFYSDLVQYGMGMIPGGKKNPTVVYNSFTPEGMPTSFLPPKESMNGANYVQDSSDVATCTREFFERSTLQLILTGHKPQGDMPSPIKVGQSSWVICADTSYSGDTKWFHDHRNVTTPEKMERRQLLQERKRSNLGRGDSISFRGETAVSEVLVELSKGATFLESIRYHGVLSDGTEYESVDLLGADSEDFDQNSTEYIGSVGQVAPTSMVPDPSNSPHEGRWWTKSICRDGSRLYYAGEGYQIWNYIVSPDSTERDDTKANGAKNN